MDETHEAAPRRHADYGPGSHPPLDDVRQAPEGFPIKGNAGSRLYHVPGSQFYERTVAEVWFASAEAAEGAGFRLPRTQRKITELPVAPTQPELQVEASVQPEPEPDPEPDGEVEPDTDIDEEAEALADAEQAAPAGEPSGYVSSFSRPGAIAPEPLAAPTGTKRLLPAIGAGVLAFLILRAALRRREG